LDTAHVINTRFLQGGNDANAEAGYSQHDETDDTGGGEAHENQPQFKVIAYIQRVA
jgi:hypothetical protein